MSKIKRPEPEDNSASPLFLAATMGMHVVSGVIVGVLIGYGLDHWLDIAPWGMVIGVIIGLIGGFRTLYVDAQRLIKMSDAGKKSVKKHPPED